MKKVRSSKNSSGYEIPKFKMLQCSICNKPTKVDSRAVKVICSLCSVIQSLGQYQKDEELKKIKKGKKIKK